MQTLSKSFSGYKTYKHVDTRYRSNLIYYNCVSSNLRCHQLGHLISEMLIYEKKSGTLETMK